MRAIRTSTSCLLIALAATAIAAGGQAPQPTFRSGVSIVNVDVIVSGRNGEPITDLTADDFEILENGKRQEIEQFRLVRVDGRPKAGAPEPRVIRSLADEDMELASSDVRVFVIFLDDYHVTRAAAMRARQRLIPLVRSQLGPNDLVAIMTPLTPVSALTFTRNQDGVVDAFGRFEGRADDLSPRNQAESAYAYMPPAAIRMVRRQVVLGAMQALAVKLGSVREGRKSVLYISEGWRSGPVVKGSLLDEVLTAANRQNVAFYPIDLRGTGTGGRAGLPSADSVMSLLADETGGRATIGRDTFEEGLAHMVRDSSAYYLLGYTARAGNDGKFHEIKVRVNRRDVEVRARKGYWAMSEEDALRAALPPTPEIDPSIVATLGSIERGATREGYGKTWVGTSRGDPGRTRVMVVWEGGGEARTLGEVAGARVLVSATDSAGTPLLSGRVAEAAGTSTTRSVAFDSTPGVLDLRIDVADADGAIVDSERRRVTIPDLTAASTISTPRLYRGRTAREIGAVRDDAAAVPLATREFSRADRLLIKFDVYNGVEGAAPRATLINRRGQRLTALPVAPATAGGTHSIELALGFVAIGDYVVEIATSGADSEVTALMAFRVAG